MSHKSSLSVNPPDSALYPDNFISSKNYLIKANPLLFGINGHPLTQEAYLQNSLNAQAALIKELNLNYYRVDMLLNDAGKIADGLRFQQLVQKFREEKIKILPVILNSSWEKLTEASDCFLLGQSIGEKFALKFHKFGNHYELGNEEDSKLLDAKFDGNLVQHYDSQKVILLINYFQGLIKGIKTIDKNAKIIINSSGWLHIGYFKILEKAQVPYDILGYHWYSDMGDLNNLKFNVLDSLGLFNKPVWFTEINRRNGSKEGEYTANTTFKESDSKLFAQSQWINRYLEQLTSKTFVKAVFIYELYDQPAFDDQKGFEAPHEAYLGLLRWIKPYSVFLRKPGFYGLKAKIEEMHDGVHNYISFLVFSFTGKNPTIPEINEIVKNLNLKSDFNLFIRENQTIVTTSLIIQKYKLLINREPTPAELKYWSEFSSEADLLKQVTIQIISDNAFWVLSGSSDKGFINRLYLKLLKREPDGMGERYWLEQLNNNLQKSAIVAAMLNSEEYKQKFMQEALERLLFEEIDPMYKEYTSIKYKNVFSEYNYIIDLVSSKYFWEKAQKYAGEKKTSIY